MSNPQDKTDAIREVLGYFLEHPQTADTVEGLARWRLAGAQKHRTVEQIREALDWLVENGYLAMVSKPYTGSIYSIAKEDLPRGRSFLESGSAQGQ
ncbi:MAG: hypothetical protein LAP86_03545 [Acidobacteriia bacterium]|nr:hypothetical protein [Terriglobia bacterium]